MRRAMSMTSWDEGNLTCAQCRYLSVRLSTLAQRNEARAGGLQDAVGDRPLLFLAQLLAQLEAVEVGPALQGTELEPRSEPGADLADGMKVATHVRRGLARVGMVRVVAGPPCRRALVEPRDVELVDHEEPAPPHELGEVRARLAERVDVVEGHDRDRGVERSGRLVDVEQCDALDARRVRARIDREHVVAGVAQ